MINKLGRVLGKVCPRGEEVLVNPTQLTRI